MPQSNGGEREEDSRAIENLGEGSLKEPKDDLLGYAPFAKNLSQALRKISPTDGLVLALYGSWGAGKSTMLNFVEKNLQEQADCQELAIVRFNPWWFSGQEDLVRVFFVELIGGLGLNRFSDEAKKFLKEKIAPVLRVFGKLVSKMPTDAGATVAPGAEFLNAAGEGVYQIGKELEGLGLKSLTEAKEDIEKKLKKISKKILIIVDDIDRLTSEEIRQMLRLIKAVANFSNVMYLLSFDKRVVTVALGAEQVSGEDYLAKIVQIAFELPLPDQISLRTMLEQRLNRILKNTPNELFDEHDWSEAYEDRFGGSKSNGIRHFIETPRDVVRLTNYLSLTYPPVEGEVNAVDFITIETLRIHCPAVYNLVRKNPDSFCLGYRSRPSPPGSGPPGSSGGVPVPDMGLKEFHETSLRKLVEVGQINEDDIEPVKRLLTQMFPKLSDIVWPGLTHYTVRPGFNPAVDGQPLRRKGVGYNDVFPFYFRLSPPEGGISRADAIRACKDIDSFRERLKELAEGRAKLIQSTDRFLLGRPSQMEGLLTWLSGNIDAIPEDNAGPMFRAVFDNLDINSNRSLLGNLLGRVPKHSRLKLLKDILNGTTSLERKVTLVRDLGEISGKFGSRSPKNVFGEAGQQLFIDPQELAELETLAADKIKQAADNDTIWNSPRLRLLLSRWNAWGGAESLKHWGETTIRERLPILLEHLVELRSSRRPPGGMDLPPGSELPPPLTDFDFLRPQWLKLFIKPSELVDRARKLPEQKLSTRQKEAVAALIETYDAQQQQPKEDPFEEQ
jgi:predicted KAP-like P-loop ATPase